MSYLIILMTDARRTVLTKTGSVTFFIKCQVHKCRCGILVLSVTRWL